VGSSIDRFGERLENPMDSFVVVEEEEEPIIGDKRGVKLPQANAKNLMAMARKRRLVSNSPTIPYKSKQDNPDLGPHSFNLNVVETSPSAPKIPPKRAKRAKKRKQQLNDVV